MPVVGVKRAFGQGHGLEHRFKVPGVHPGECRFFSGGLRPTRGPQNTPDDKETARRAKSFLGFSDEQLIGSYTRHCKSNKRPVNINL